MGLLFGFLVKFYSERQSRNQLIKDANAIYDIVLSEEKITDLSEPLAKQEIRKKIYEQLGRIESNFALVSKDLKVLYPRYQEAEKFENQILPQISRNINTRTNKFMRIEIEGTEYLLVILPPRSNVSQGLKGSIVLYNSVGSLQKINRAMVFVLILSLMITAVIAIIAGVLMAKKIARPIIMLKNRAESLSRLEFDGNVEIHTGDELEELGDTINRMASDLKEHDLTQKNFFQNASHELKTPLMSIQGYAEGIKDKVFEDNDKALDIIIDESKRLKVIVDDLIYLSKIESNEDFYTFKAENMNEVIKGSIEKLMGISMKDNIDIKLSLADDFVLDIDRDKMIQALINIMGNCLRYAKSLITVQTIDSESVYKIIISDNGCGFSDEEQKYLFRRFYKGKNGSSGLGLAITKSIIEKHKGKIDADNRPEGGARFTITLPKEL